MSSRLLKDPAFVTVCAAFVAGVVFGLRAGMVGWLLGLAIGIVFAAFDARSTPRNRHRFKFTTYVGSGRFGGPLVYDSRLLMIFGLGLLGLVAGLTGGLVRKFVT
jgi:ABC-type amino acid transport system permease subunit